MEDPPTVINGNAIRERAADVYAQVVAHEAPLSTEGPPPRGPSADGAADESHGSALWGATGTQAFRSFSGAPETLGRMTTAIADGSSGSARRAPSARQMLNKVPEVTLYFWIIKVLCTTVGETFADFLNTNLGLGLNGTIVVMGALLLAVLVVQFRKDRYVPPIYWLAVVLISVVGTLITDKLTDSLGVSLVVSTAVFSVLLAVTFAVWFAFERTLSIHTIFTTRRETFYWTAILFTFALGTAGGDLMSEKLALGYWVAAAIFAGAIAVVAVLHFVFKLNAVLAFWLAYILTRPLGASIGDGMSQTGGGGLGLGTTVTSIIFLGTILPLVAYLSKTRIDQTSPDVVAREQATGGAAQVLVVTDEAQPTPALLDAIRGRALRGPVAFELLVPNPAPAEWNPTQHDQHRQADDAKRVLAEALPSIQDVTHCPVRGDVSIRHDPMDAIEEALRNGAYSEIMVAMVPHGPLAWLHLDLPHRIAHLGLPLTTVSASRSTAPVPA